MERFINSIKLVVGPLIKTKQKTFKTEGKNEESKRCKKVKSNNRIIQKSKVQICKRCGI